LSKKKKELCSKKRESNKVTRLPGRRAPPFKLDPDKKLSGYEHHMKFGTARDG